jgi:hypothetical protein
LEDELPKLWADPARSAIVVDTIRRCQKWTLEKKVLLDNALFKVLKANIMNLRAGMHKDKE